MILGVKPSTCDQDRRQVNELFHFKRSVTLESLISNLTSLGWQVSNWNTSGLFSEAFLYRINPHWLSYPPPPDHIFDLLAFAYVFLMVVGVFGNSLVIFMFIRRRSLRTAANILVMNLAVSDLFLILKTPIFIYNCIKRGPALGELGCTLYGFVGGLTGTVSIVTLTAIAVDRYNVIVHPFIRKPKQTNYTTIIFLWLYGAFFATLPLLKIGFNNYTPEGYLASCSFDYVSSELNARFTVLLFFFFAWVLPFGIITGCYGKICWAVLKNSDTNRHYKESVRRRREIKLAMVVIAVVGLWFVSWTPYAVLALMGVAGVIPSPGMTMLPALFCKTASCIDPFVYAITHPRFRRELQSIFRGSRFRASMEFTKAPTIQLRRKCSVEEVVVMVKSNTIWYTKGDVYKDEEI